MRLPHQLDRCELERIVRIVHDRFYRTPEGDLDPDLEVSGGDLVELVGSLFRVYKLVPPADPAELEGCGDRAESCDGDWYCNEDG